MLWATLTEAKFLQRLLQKFLTRTVITEILNQAVSLSQSIAKQSRVWILEVQDYWFNKHMFQTASWNPGNMQTQAAFIWRQWAAPKYQINFEKFWTTWRYCPIALILMAARLDFFSKHCMYDTVSCILVHRLRNVRTKGLNSKIEQNTDISRGLTLAIKGLNRRINDSRINHQSIKPFW